MKTVASRELRNHTAAVLAEVADGGVVAVTVHGSVVAEIHPSRRPRPDFITRSELIAFVEKRRSDPQLVELLDEISADTTETLDTW